MQRSEGPLEEERKPGVKHVVLGHGVFRVSFDYDFYLLLPLPVGRVPLLRKTA